MTERFDDRKMIRTPFFCHQIFLSLPRSSWSHDDDPAGDAVAVAVNAWPNGEPILARVQIPDEAGSDGLRRVVDASRERSEAGSFRLQVDAQLAGRGRRFER